jgi:hypothetical protein
MRPVSGPEAQAVAVVSAKESAVMVDYATQRIGPRCTRAHDRLRTIVHVHRIEKIIGVEEEHEFFRTELVRGCVDPMAEVSVVSSIRL